MSDAATQAPSAAVQAAEEALEKAIATTPATGLTEAQLGPIFDRWVLQSINGSPVARDVTAFNYLTTQALPLLRKALLQTN